jgi:non-specific protein-tyrosine kinase
VTINDYLQIVRKRLLIVLSCAVLGLGAAGALVWLATPKYEATAQLFVSANDTGGGLATDLQQGAQFSQDRVQSYAAIINTRQITDPVAHRLQVGLTGEEISKEIQADAPLNTVLVNLHVTDISAKRAQHIANAVANQFANYAAFLEASADDTHPPVKVTVVKEATLPTSPTSPKVGLSVALGLIIGLVVGIAGGILRETLDNTVKTPDDVQRATDRPAIGVIAFDPDAKAHPLIVTQHPHSRRAEAFRQLRTNLQFVDIDTELKSIVVTSSVPNEGKTTTVSNLAITLAQAGSKVLLIEADLRRPRLAKYLGLDGSVGLTSVLVGATSALEATQRWGESGLSVLPSGPLPPNPSELLSSNAMRQLIKRLEARFDLILIDAPPLLPVTDAAVLSAATSGALLIARYGSTKREQLARSAEALLDGVGARILGCVINMTPKRGPDAYYYGYAYSYRDRSRGTQGRSARAGTLPKATPSAGVLPGHLASVPIRPYFPGETNGNGSQGRPAEVETAGDGLDPIITDPPRRPTSSAPAEPARANGSRQPGVGANRDPLLDEEDPTFSEVASRPLRVSRLGTEDLPSSPPAES